MSFKLDIGITENKRTRKMFPIIQVVESKQQCPNRVELLRRFLLPLLKTFSCESLEESCRRDARVLPIRRHYPLMFNHSLQVTLLGFVVSATAAS